MSTLSIPVPLVHDRWCKGAGCRNRLSVEDLGDKCLECREAPLEDIKAEVYAPVSRGLVCCVCKREPVTCFRGKCKRCAKEYRDRRREALYAE